MNLSQSIELQADIRDVAQQFSWQSSIQQRNDNHFVSSTRNRFNTQASFQAQPLLNFDVTSTANVTSESNFSSVMEAGSTMVLVQARTWAMEFSPRDTLASQIGSSSVTSASWTIQESSWNLNLRNGLSMASTSIKVEGIPTPLATDNQLTSALTLSEDLHFTSQTTTWTLESTNLFKRTDSWSSETTQQFSLGEDAALNDPLFAPRLTLRQDTQTMNLESAGPWGNWQFNQTFTKTQSMPAMESVPRLELERTPSLRIENSNITSDLNPTFELCVSRTDTLLTAMPDLKLQSGQQVAMGLLSVGLG